MNLLHANDRAGEYPASYYAATATPLDAFPALAGDVTADVCVVGAGYTGLSTALHLAEAGFSVVVVEAQRVGFGASGRNGGQVGSGQRLDQDDLERMVGRSRARALWDMGQDAKALVKGRIAQHNMPVTFHPGVGLACRTVAEVDHARVYAERLARDYGYAQIDSYDRAAFRGIVGSDAYQGGEVDRGAGHLHPLNFAIGLAKAALAAGVRIFEGSEVTRVDHGAKPVVHTVGGRVTCAHVVLAGNGYLGGLEPKVSARVMPINNFILATEPLGDVAKALLSENIAVADSKFVVNYWRLSEDNRLLFGGGESYGYRFPDIIKTVTKPMLEVYPGLRDARIDYAWGGTLAITTNRMPAYIRVSDNILAASSCSGHGIALSTLSGKILAECIAGQAAGFDLMANLPQMKFPGGATLRWPLLVAAMTWYSLRDRLGI